MTTILTDNLVNISSVQLSGSLRDALVVCCQIDSAEKQIKAVGDTTYGRLRLEAYNVWMEEVEKVGGDAEKLDLGAVRGIFEARLEVEEEWLKADDCPFEYLEGKLPRKWINAKSQIGIAIENGFDFSHDSQVGQSALRKFNEKEKSRKEESAKAERARKAAEKGEHVKDASKAKPAEKPAEGEGKAPEGGAEGEHTPTQTPAAKIPVGGTALSEEQLAMIADLLEKVNAIANAKGGKSVDGILKSFKNQVEQKYAAIGAALEDLAKAV